MLNKITFIIVLLISSIIIVNLNYLRKLDIKLKILNQNNHTLIAGKLNKFAEYLKVNTAIDHNGSMKLKRLGRDNDGGYIAPIKAIENADVIMGYGIADDISFEEDVAKFFNKPVYGFDCGLKKFDSQSKLFTFIPECIGNDKYLYDKNSSSMKITSFSEQINNLKLSDKKIFIKMDIEGAEYDAFKDILPSANLITGIVLEIHFDPSDYDSIETATSLLHNINKNFVLVHVHGNNYKAHAPYGFKTVNSVGRIPEVLELSYINKNLINSYQISDDQSHPTMLDMPNNKYSDEAIFEILN